MPCFGQTFCLHLLGKTCFRIRYCHSTHFDTEYTLQLTVPVPEEAPATKACGEVEIQLHEFFTSTLVFSEWLASSIAALLPSPRCPFHILSGLQSRSGRFRKDKKKLLLIRGREPWFLGRPGRSLVTIHTELSHSVNSITRHNDQFCAIVQRLHISV